MPWYYIKASPPPLIFLGNFWLYDLLSFALPCVAKVAYVQVICSSFRWIIAMSLCLDKGPFINDVTLILDFPDPPPQWGRLLKAVQRILASWKFGLQQNVLILVFGTLLIFWACFKTVFIFSYSKLDVQFIYRFELDDRLKHRIQIFSVDVQKKLPNYVCNRK